MTQYSVPMKLPHLDAAMRDAASESAESRWVAALALGQERGERGVEAVNALERLSRDPVIHVSVQAIEGLAEQARGGAAVPSAPIEAALHSDAVELRCAAIDASVDIIADSGPVIVRLLEDSDPSVRATAAEALRHIQSPDHIEPLRRRLDDPSRWVRTSAALALTELGQSSGSTILLDTIARRDGQALDAAAALGELADPDLARDLYSLATRRFTSLELKSLLAAALSLCGDRRGGEILEQLLSSRWSRRRLAALQSVAWLGPSAVVASVGRLTGAKNRLEASAAIAGLSAIAKRDPGAARPVLQSVGSFVDPSLSDELNELIETMRTK